MKASDLMTDSVHTVTADATCDAAAAIMFEVDVGSVPVVDPQGGVVGMITDRDVCRCAYTKDCALSEIPVKEAMTRDVISVRPGDAVAHVEELMRVNQIRRIPVIDDDGLLRGIISMADIARMVGAADDVSDIDIAETLDAIVQPHAL